MYKILCATNTEGALRIPKMAPPWLGHDAWSELALLMLMQPLVRLAAPTSS